MSSARIESLKIILPVTLVLFLVLLLPGWIAGLCATLLLVFLAFTFYFFRDPERHPPTDPATLCAAADGLVTHIEEVESAPFGLGRMKRVSVFLSVFDVHVNRTPFAGTVTATEHTPGAYFDVRDERSALQNEHQDWQLQTDRGPLVVRQIAGLIARRIVGWAKVGDTLATGQRFGMIRFGSRTDLFLPINTEILVRIGDRVQGGLTPVARWTEASFNQFMS